MEVEGGGETMCGKEAETLGLLAPILKDRGKQPE